MTIHLFVLVLEVGTAPVPMWRYGRAGVESLRVHGNEGDSFVLFGERVHAPTGRGQRRVSSVLL